MTIQPDVDTTGQTMRICGGCHRKIEHCPLCKSSDSTGDET